MEYATGRNADSCEKTYNFVRFFRARNEAGKSPLNLLCDRSLLKQIFVRKIFLPSSISLLLQPYTALSYAPLFTSSICL